MPLDDPRSRAVPVTVADNRRVAQDTFRLGFDEPELAASAGPGQFLMVLLPGLRDPLLPRPFAVFDRVGDRVEILYRRVGKATGLLTTLRPGDGLQVLGPLGNGFSIPAGGGRFLVMAGGCGIASVHLLLRRLATEQAPPTLLYGVRRQPELVPLRAWDEGTLRVELATEDGAEGFHGTVTDLLDHRIAGGKIDPDGVDQVFLCGPPPMLRATAGLLDRHGLRGQFSLETRMACGYGVCQGCVVPTRDRSGNAGDTRYRRVCTHGPVFNGEDLPWEVLGS